ncbi:hypothetical protein MY5147_004998 [Beauveria neobassiana]
MSSSMPSSMPSPCFTRRTVIWKQLALRSDVDDIILELLGQFSLEKLYLSAGEKTRYQTVMINLLVQLDAIFYIQRLTIPSRQLQPGLFLGFLVSWEVAARTVELILQTIVEGRDHLWEATALRDEYLAEFLLGALRVLQLHPRSPPLQRPKDRRARFARIHRLLEQIFDAYPGQKSFLLTVCKEITQRLHEDANSLSLPPKMQQAAPNLTTEMVRTKPKYQSASLQYSAKSETCDEQLFRHSLASRNAIFAALQNLQIPSQFSKVDVVASFNAYFRLILWHTPDLAHSSLNECSRGEYVPDALDELTERLTQRRAIQRSSDREMTLNISKITRSIQIQDDPEGSYITSQSPSQYVLNCPSSHTVGGSQLRATGVTTTLDSTPLNEVKLPEQATCIKCDERVTVARELPLARKAWELLSPLQVPADSVNAERHMSNSFQLSSPDTEPHDIYSYSTFTAGLGGHLPTTLDSSMMPARPQSMTRDTAPSIMDLSSNNSLGPSYSISKKKNSLLAHISPWITAEPPKRDTSPEIDPGSSYSQQGNSSVAELSYFSIDTMQSHKPSNTEPSITSPAATRLPPGPDKARQRWRVPIPFASAKRPLPTVSGDSSSFSSNPIDEQPMEEIPLKGLVGSGLKPSTKTKAAASIHHNAA